MAVSNILTPRKLKAALAASYDKPKIISDGNGLYLRIRPDSSASWFFAKTVDGRRRELGLGSVASVDLDDAREKAGEARKAIAQGRDPFAEKAAAKREARDTAEVPTFGEFADQYISSVEAGWRNEKHRSQWKQTLKVHAAMLSKMPVDEIGTDDVLKVLRPLWTTKPETASRVRGRIERVLNAAKAKGLRPRDSFNPALLKGHLDILLPKRRTLSRGHHRALPVADAPAFMAKLRARPALAARALEFAILTAARTGECLGARWGEVDAEARTWTVPADRMKAGKEHIVPLSGPALALLAKIRPEKLQPGDLIFANRGRGLSNMALLALLRRLKVDATAHGFRSTFRDWAGDVADFPRELAEQALAHVVRDRTEAAYRRNTAVERRRALMAAWADYLSGAAAVALAA